MLLLWPNCNLRVNQFNGLNVQTLDFFKKEVGTSLRSEILKTFKNYI